MAKDPLAGKQVPASLSRLKERISKLVIHPKTGRRGAEQMDPTPVAQALNFKKKPSIIDQLGEIRRIAREEASLYAASKGAETFKEADDFDVDDDDDPMPESRYEANFDPIPEQDHEALAGRAKPPAAKRPENTSSSTKSQPKGEGEGAAEGSPDTPSDAPAGYQRVTGYFRRPPTKENGDT